MPVSLAKQGNKLIIIKITKQPNINSFLLIINENHDHFQLKDVVNFPLHFIIDRNELFT